MPWRRRLAHAFPAKERGRGARVTKNLKTRFPKVDINPPFDTFIRLLTMPRRTDIHSILIIGSGPIVIGQGCEFDYSGVQACRALKEEGYRIVLINSNPATIMTDPEFADATYIEPITPEAVEKILEREKANGTPIDALLPTLGGQTGLNTGMACFDQGILQKYNVQMIGANREAIWRGEDRQRFKELMAEIGLKTPTSGVVHNMDDARETL